MNTAEMIILIVAIIAVAAALWMYFEKEKTRKLRGKFGPEYDRLVQENKGNARRAEAVLEHRQQRVSKFNIRVLTVEERGRYVSEWRRVQEQFVDDPRESVARADQLVTEAMRTRGYPMGDFEQLASDVSVDHPHVVDNYRVAHDIAVRDKQSNSNTEELRKAMQHYRSLFEDLLDAHITNYEEVNR